MSNNILTTLAASMAIMSSPQSYRLPSYNKPPKGVMDNNTKRRRSKNKVAKSSRRKNRK